MKYLVYLFSVCLASSVCSSCHHEIRNKADLIGYINNPDNGLHQTHHIGEIDVSLTYHPSELVALKQSPGDAANRTKTSNTYADKYFFVLSFSSHHKELLKQLPFNQYSEMVQVISFRMMDFISLIPDQAKAVTPLDCLFQQTYGMSDANELLLVFDRKKLASAEQLTFNVKEFGLNTGNLNFKIETKAINNIPTINYQHL